jgi:hypothetical protein
MPASLYGMGYRRSRFVLLVALAAGASLVVAARDAAAVGQATGRVLGTVLEAETRAPVPGASAVLSGGSGVHKGTATRDDGTFEIDAVPPGAYDLVVTYDGMKPLKRRVIVNPDAATPVTILWSAEAAKQETTVVEEERHLSNPDSPQTGQIYSTDRTNQLPVQRQYLAIAAQVPGVTALTGANNPSVKGARSDNNRYLVNGLDVTDPVTNKAGAQFQQDALETVQVTTGGFEAKYNALGSVFAVQTKRGTNEYHGAASAYWAPTALVDYATFGPQSYDASKPWDYNSQRPEQGRYDLNLSAQGPLVRDHLFFNAGVEYQRAVSVQPAGPPRFVQAPSAVVESIYLLGGITFVPVDSHRLHLEAFADPTSSDYEKNNTASANATQPYSQNGRTFGGERVTFEWAWQASSHVATKVMVGSSENRVDTGPQGLRGINPSDGIPGVPYDFQRPSHTNGDDGTTWFNSDVHTVNVRRRLQLDAAITATFEGLGRHEAELGLQSAFTSQHVVTSYPGGTSGPNDATGFGVAYSDRGGGPLDTGLCDIDPAVNPNAVHGVYSGTGCYRRTISESSAAAQRGSQFGIYIQDRFKPKEWLTILPGLRWDSGSVEAVDSSVATNAYGLGPRLSVLADLTGDQRTIAQVSYGRMTEMPSLGGVAAYDTARRSFAVVEQYDPVQRRFVFQQTTGGDQSVRMNFGHVPASADEILLSARRELGTGTLVRVDYTYRATRRQFEAVEVNAIMDPTGTRTIGFANGVPTRVSEYGFATRSFSEYSGLDVILEARTERVEIQGGYTLSYSWGTVGSGAFDNPRFDPFYHSYQAGTDTRHQIKTATTVHVVGGLVAGAVVNWRSGVALAAGYPANEAGYTIRRAPSGYDPGAFFNTGTSNPGQLGTFSDVRSWTELRSPDLLTCNVMLSYDFAHLLQQHVTVNLEIDNVLALPTPTGLTTNQGAPNTSQYGLVNSRQGFRTLTLGARYDF